MDNKILAHTQYNCTYHIVFIPKYRRKVMYGRIGKEVGGYFIYGMQNYRDTAILASRKICQLWLFPPIRCVIIIAYLWDNSSIFGKFYCS